MLESVIFDLDGTLIDSSESILAGFDAVLKHHKMAPKVPLTATIIGPPLRQTLALLSGSSSPELLAAMTETFKAYYDTEGYKATRVFPGIEDMLQRLQAAGISLHIATNKRLAPTTLILKHLGWSDYFKSVFALDICQPAFPSKSAMLGHQLAAQAISTASAAYVGDRVEDGMAADANHLTFYAATWGYSGFPNAEWSQRWIKAGTPNEIPCA